MRAALLIAMIAGVVYGAYAYQSSGSDRPNDAKQGSSIDTKSGAGAPRTGYPDPYIPPTKGNGF